MAFIRLFRKDHISIPVMRLESPFLLLVMLSGHYGIGSTAFADDERRSDYKSGSGLTAVADDRQSGKGQHENPNAPPRCSKLVEEHYKGGPTVGILWDLLAKCSDSNDDMNYFTAQSLLQSIAATPATGTSHDEVGDSYDVSSLSEHQGVAMVTLDTEGEQAAVETTTTSMRPTGVSGGGQDSAGLASLSESLEASPESALRAKTPVVLPSRQDPFPAQTKPLAQPSEERITSGDVRSREGGRGIASGDVRSREGGREQRRAVAEKGMERRKGRWGGRRRKERARERE